MGVFTRRSIDLLEDDIRFNITFSKFMDWALENHEDSKRIFHINGLSVIDSFRAEIGCLSHTLASHGVWHMEN